MNPLRDLPAVDKLLAQAGDLRAEYGHTLTVEALRHVLDEARQHLLENGGTAPTEEALLAEAAQTLHEWLAPSLLRVVNATGVIIHTNLGRAPLSDEAIAAINGIARGYSTLEFNLESGKRGSREVHAEALLCRLTGAEAALVVNNNAAATMLALSALAAGQGVLVSRGQLVEIGGGYRMPDVMAASGARMVEVGTTNRTHLYDYERAIDAETGAIIRVHHSNYAVVGFVTEPSIEDLEAVAYGHGLVLIDDLGSGALLDTAQFGLAAEPTVGRSIAAGADVILFSGDKLLGGPQAGILVGRAHIIERIRKHPLARAVRADKLALAALTATLTHYLKGEALEKVPVWQMISASLESLRARAVRWREAASAAGLSATIIEGESTVGGGSVPGSTLPTTLLALDVPSAEEAAFTLRRADPPVIARIENDRLLLDPRTVLARDEDDLIRVLTTPLPTGD